MDDFYSLIPGVDKKISRIVFGTAITSMLYGKSNITQLNEAYFLGITAFDTARNYAGAEISLGKWIKSCSVRENIVIISKCAHPDETGKRVNERAIRVDFAKSQEYLCTDYIDIYMLHRDDPDVPVGEIIGLFNDLKREGKIKAFGASNWTTERINSANEYASKNGLEPFAVSSPNFSLAHQIRDPWGGGCVTITGDENSYQREYYRKTQMPVFAYSALGRGFFSGRFSANDREAAKNILDSVALNAYDCEENYRRLSRCEEIAEIYGVAVGQIALKWIYTQGMNVFSVVSTSNKERLKQNIEALSVPLTQKQCEYLNLEREDYE